MFCFIWYGLVGYLFSVIQQKLVDTTHVKSVTTGSTACSDPPQSILTMFCFTWNGLLGFIFSIIQQKLVDINCVKVGTACSDSEENNLTNIRGFKLKCKAEVVVKHTLYRRCIAVLYLLVFQINLPNVLWHAMYMLLDSKELSVMGFQGPSLAVEAHSRKFWPLDMPLDGLPNARSCEHDPLNTMKH
jgi:hypothetical protein